MFLIFSIFTSYQISTNATRLDYPPSTSTWLTFVTMTLTVQTPKDPTTAHVLWDTMEMEEIVMVGDKSESVLQHSV